MTLVALVTSNLDDPGGSSDLGDDPGGWSKQDNSGYSGSLNA